MSTKMKDARWELAYEILELVGLDSNELGYYEFQRVLETAQILIEAKPAMIEPLETLWRARD